LLVAAAKQDDHGQPIASKIHPVSWTPIDPQCADTATDALTVAEVTALDSLKPSQDARLGLPVPQPGESLGKGRTALRGAVMPNLEHR
jgi:hypothetical protein